MALPRRGGRLPGRLAADHGRQPAARGDGPDLLPALRDRLQPGAAGRPGRHQLGRAVPRRPGHRGRVGRTRPGAADRPPGPGRRRRAGRPVRGLPPGSGRPSGHDPGFRAGARRHDAVRHPGLPAAPRRAGRRDQPDPGAGRAAGDRADRDRASPGQWPRARFDAAFLAVGAQAGQRAYIPAGDSARILDAVRYLHEVAEGEPPQLGRRVVVYGGGNTAMDAARTARRLGATDAIVVYRRTRDRMPAHDSEVAEADRGGHHAALAVHHRRGRGRGPDHREDAAGRDRVPAADRGVRGARGGRRGARPGPGAGTRPARRRARGRIRPRHGPGRPEHDDRPPGRVRRRGHDPVRAHRDRGHRPRQEGRQEHRRLAARPGPGRRPPSTRWPPSTGSTRGTTPTRRPPSGRNWRSPGGSPRSTR